MGGFKRDLSVWGVSLYVVIDQCGAFDLGTFEELIFLKDLAETFAF